MSYATTALTAISVSLVLLAGCSGAPASPPQSPTPTPAGPTTAVVAMAQQTADRFAQSVLDQDRDAFDAAVTDRDPGFVPTATMLYDNLHRLAPTSFSVKLTGQRAELGADRRGTLGEGAVALQAQIGWQVPGDGSAADHLVTLTFVPGPDGPLIAGTTDGPRTQQPLWWFTPIRAAQQHQVTVIASDGVEVDAWLQRATRAAEAVADERGSSAALVLMVPGSAAALERILNRTLDEQIAALAFTDGSDAATSPSRVVVNPASVSGLGEPALDFLLAHEAVHAATSSPRSPAPMWVVEGYADLVASRAYPEAQDKAATSLLTQVRRDGPPAALPDDEAFRAEADDLSRTYAEAWFAFRFLADEYSMVTATAFYDRLGSEFDGDVDRAMPAILKQSPAAFTRGWQAYLERRAR